MGLPGSPGGDRAAVVSLCVTISPQSSFAPCLIFFEILSFSYQGLTSVKMKQHKVEKGGVGIKVQRTQSEFTSLFSYSADGVTTDWSPGCQPVLFSYKLEIT